MDKWYNRELLERDQWAIWHEKFVIGTGIKK
jgi:hypothetical protein